MAVKRTINKNTGNLKKDFADCIVDYKSGVGRNVDTVSTGSIKFDLATGIGGFPLGRITELFGVEGSSKTTLALHVIANAQKKKMRCAFVDTEHTLSFDYAETIGVKTKDLLYAQPQTLEQTFDFLYRLTLEKEKIDVIVFDSIGLTPLFGETRDHSGKSHMGDRATLLWEHCRKIQSIISKRNIMCLYLNQVTDSFDAWTPFSTPGGRAMKFATTFRVQLTPGQKQAIELDGNPQPPFGVIVNLTMMKNKLSMPFKKAQTILRFGEGYDRELEIIDMSLLRGFLVQKGSWFSHKGKNLAQGKISLREYLIKEGKLIKELEKQCTTQETS